MQGRIEFLNEKPWGNKTLYSLKLSGDNTLYMCGGDKPQASRGDYVNFDVSVNQKGQAIVGAKTLKVMESEVNTPQTAGVSRSFTTPFKKNDDDRQRRIEWQAARNSALTAAGLLLGGGALKMPAKETAKYAAIMAMIADLTKQFFNETATLGEVPEAVVKEPEEKPEAVDDEGSWDV